MVTEDQNGLVLQRLFRVGMSLSRKGILVRFLPDPFHFLFRIVNGWYIMSQMAGVNAGSTARLLRTLLGVYSHSPFLC